MDWLRDRTIYAITMATPHEGSFLAEVGEPAKAMLRDALTQLDQGIATNPLVAGDPGHRGLDSAAAPHRDDRRRPRPGGDRRPDRAPRHRGAARPPVRDDAGRQHRSVATGTGQTDGGLAHGRGAARPDTRLRGLGALAGQHVVRLAAHPRGHGDLRHRAPEGAGLDLHDDDPLRDARHHVEPAGLGRHHRSARPARRDPRPARAHLRPGRRRRGRCRQGHAVRAGRRGCAGVDGGLRRSRRPVVRRSLRRRARRVRASSSPPSTWRCSCRR